MMHGISMEGRFKALLSMLFAMVLALGVFFPSAALAETTGVTAANQGTATGKLTVTGLTDGDKVDIYKIVNTTIQGDNTLKHEFAADYGISFDAYKVYASDSVEMKKAAETIGSSANLGVVAQPQKTATGTSVEFTGLSAGEYLVKVTPASGKVVYQWSIAKLEYTAETGGVSYKLNDGSIAVKNTPVTIDKKATGEDADTHNTSQYSVGQVIPYTAEVTIPQYPSNATNRKFKVTDTMTAGLTYMKAVGFSIMVGSTDVSGSFDITHNADGFVAEIKSDAAAAFFSTYNAGQKLTIKYGGKINSSAVVNTPDVNTITLEFANNPYDEHSNDTVTDHVDNSTFGLKLVKVDNDTASPKPLQGAEFTVYTDSACEHPMVDENGSVIKLTTNAQGIGTAKGFGEGTFYVKETKAPAGYTPSGDIKTVTFKATKTSNPGGGYTITIEHEGTGEYLNFYDAGSIVNVPQPGLPVTGGAGTVALTVVGVGLMAAAGVIVARSRKNEA